MNGAPTDPLAIITPISFGTRKAFNSKEERDIKEDNKIEEASSGKSQIYTLILDNFWVGWKWKKNNFFRRNKANPIQAYSSLPSDFLCW